MKRIPLTQGKYALVDDDDFEELNKYKWFSHCSKYTTYARRNITVDGKQKTISMHSVILNTPSGMHSDHKDGNGLKNTRANLRVCTSSQNLMNIHNRAGTSIYKGVSWKTNRNRWCAQISVNKNVVHLGLFFCVVKAARAYDAAANKHFGEYACLNFPGDKL